MLPFVLIEEKISIGIAYATVAFIISSIAIFMIRRRRQVWHVPNIIMVIICALVGIPLYIVGGNIGDYTYMWSHGLWHNLAAIAALFVVDIKHGTIISRLVSKVCKKTLVITAYFDGSTKRVLKMEMVSLKKSNSEGENDVCKYSLKAKSSPKPKLKSETSYGSNNDPNTQKKRSFNF